MLEGKVDGSRGRGRRRKSWTTNIAEMTNMRVNAAAKAAMEREGWRPMASNLFKEKEPSASQLFSPSPHEALRSESLSDQFLVEIQRFSVIACEWE
ncbi:hypothetical protein ElyMa_005100000 [Elysia marginata]|uniref:Uncharacterized protein n=1 Tax=Elysia marginata TaxID=1093978 RepID=A0AAV4JL32_9GAST|nr:hypothetical protein ElyMa_005100000 [Elysia marginata]